MGKYGDTAIAAVTMLREGCTATPKSAWRIAVQRAFPTSVSSQEKGCPRTTFLGLCGEGLVVGVPSGTYTTSEANKAYGLKALNLLRAAPDLAHDEHALWERVMDGKVKTSNGQMDVVISLWNRSLLRV